MTATAIAQPAAAASSTSAIVGAETLGQQRGNKGGAEFSSFLDTASEGETPDSRSHGVEASVSATTKFSGSLADALIQGAGQRSTGKDVRSVDDASRTEAIDSELSELAGSDIEDGSLFELDDTATNAADASETDGSAADPTSVIPTSGQLLPVLLQFETGATAEGLQTAATRGENTAPLSAMNDALSSNGQALPFSVLKSETHFQPYADSAARLSQVLNGSTSSQNAQASLSAASAPSLSSSAPSAASETEGLRQSSLTSAALAGDPTSVAGSGASGSGAVTASNSAGDASSSNTGKRAFPSAPAASGSGGATMVPAQDASAQGEALSASASPASGTLAQQVSNAISTSSSDASQSTSRVALTTAEATQPLRTLTIGLTPQNLGEVTVRMSMNGGKLSVVLSVEKPEAAQLLAQDQEVLEGLLRSTGYKVDTISVQLAPQPVTPSAAGTSTASSDQSLSGSTDTGSDGMGQSGQKDRGEPGNRGLREGSEHGQAESHLNRTALYI
ncbi:flagellar hook-length control protein FliK [Rhodomicrobium lacus]|uniref:flagellar hook-length control protein FliK n=1 Tax=Rhodomicrobium lacus TaxID=2498452 RepID=UPI0026E306C6|nr:flagellar hook-length control protein FliK [Rhodomicrobium lacus]WKW50640.1 flagellar hook-length control protein FliK [Rhodomicrobium lacus]